MLTFVVPEEVLPTEEREVMHQIAQRAAALGEPWLTFVRPDELRARLHDLGFGRVVHLGPVEANAHYFAGRRDGLQAQGGAHQMSATV